MNCKPGDLAVVIKSEKVNDTTGAVVRVLRPYDEGVYARFGPAWWVEYQGREMHGVDAFLRPLRDPGDGAQDETLAWKPVPAETPLTPEFYAEFQRLVDEHYLNEGQG